MGSARRLFEPLPGCIPRRVVSDVCSLPSFDFQRRAPGWCLVRDPILVRSGEAPRHAALASLWFERFPLSDPDRVRPVRLSSPSRDALPADRPSPARAAEGKHDFLSSSSRRVEMGPTLRDPRAA